MKSTLITGIPPEEQPNRTWHVIVDGRSIQSVERLVIHAEAFGTLTYGRTPDGYDCWSFHEAGGGGVVVLPFIVREAQVLVGVIFQHRYNQGHETRNAPRGFLDVGRTHASDAVRELIEETGYHMGDLVDLGGEPANPNSTFFDTASPGEGVRFFGLRVAECDVEEIDGALRLRGGVVDFGAEAVNQRWLERIGETSFMPWQEAARLADMFTNAAVSRLLAYLEEHR